MKILSRGEIVERKESILEKNFFTYRRVADRGYKPKSTTNTPSPLTKTGTADFKEGLVVYFSNLSEELLKKIETKLKAPAEKQETFELPPPGDLTFYGKSSFDLVKVAVEYLGGSKISSDNDIRLFANGLSSAKSIQKIYGMPVQADRGETYTKIRKHAVDLVKEIESSFEHPDKWCPADIYIYNNPNAGKTAMETKNLYIDDTSLNAQFQSEKNNTSDKILAISLKEEVAQGGGGASFAKVLRREENYPSAEKIENYDLSSLIYHYNKAINIKTAPNVAIQDIAFGYYHAKKIKGAEEIADDLLSTIKNTLGSDVNFNTDGASDFDIANDVKRLFIAKQKENPNIKVSIEKTLDSKVGKLIANYKREIIKEYLDSRDEFVDSIRPFVKNIPAPANTDTTKSSYLLAKSGCYKTAAYVLNGLKSQGLNIPPTFKTIMKQKNPFVAWTAYAIGMAGISPTFFKIIGSATVGQLAKVETFYGDGFLNLDDRSDMAIKDSPTARGFNVEFITKVTLEDSGKTAPIKKYAVELSFQNSGETVAVKVSEMKEV